MLEIWCAICKKYVGMSDPKLSSPTRPLICMSEKQIECMKCSHNYDELEIKLKYARTWHPIILNAGRENLTPFQAGLEILKRFNWRPENDKIFIKPNIGAASKRVNTNPEFVRGMINYLKGYDITIGEGSVETEYESTDYNFRYQGWNKLAKETGVKLVDTNKSERYLVTSSPQIKLPIELRGRSYINVAKMKTHMQTTVSLCIKNQKGLLDSATRKLFHREGLHRPLAELAQILKPELGIVEGITAIEGNGPGNYGKTRHLGVVVAGTDMAEVDRTCCKVMGINPDSAEHLRLMGTRVINSPPFVASPPFILPSPEFKMFRVHMRPENACSACLSSVGKMNKLVRQTLKGFSFFSKGLLHRMDIVVGSPLSLPPGHGFCIFYGSCTKELASHHPEYPYIEGCPPVSKRALEVLSQ